MTVNIHDRLILRDLAKEVAEIAARPEITERRKNWVQHNSLRSKKPLMLIFPEGAWQELILQSDLFCQDVRARAVEWDLRHRLYTYHNFLDDSVIQAEWVVSADVTYSSWGLDPIKIPSSEARGAFRIQPVLHDRSDLKKLCCPDLLYDAAAHQRDLEQADDLFGDILEIKRKGIPQISYHLWSQYIYLRGETDFLTDFIDAPDMVHEAMTLFTEAHKRLLTQMIEMNLLSLNNDNTYHSSGGNGFTDELPAPSFDPANVRPMDIWSSSESQELAGVSPRMHREFALRYERELLAPFGLNGYGCCEDLSRKLEDVLALPHMRRISISPFADVDASAKGLKDRAIYSWKPQPAHLAGLFDENLIRAYIRHTLEVCQANGCVLEIILKDTHTCEHHPERFNTWTQIARQEMDRIGEVA